MSPKPNQINQQINPNKVRQVFFLVVLILLGIVIVNSLYFMITAFLGAVTLYVILMTPMKYLTFQKSWTPWLAALILMITSFVVMVLPLAYISSVAVARIVPLIQQPHIAQDALNQVHEYFALHFKMDILDPENVQKISGQVIPMMQKTLGGTFSAIGNVFLMYLVLYFLLVSSNEVEKWLKYNVPFKATNVEKLITEIRNIVFSNAIGIPIVAIIQGIVGMIGYWIFGVEEFILMGILTAISSVIPIIGTMAVYVPLALYQFAVVGNWQGIAVALWGFIIIGSVDNVARF
jgi:predicted PurR-regulated permease PerM